MKLLGGVALAAVILRLLWLGSPSLTVDEGMSFLVSQFWRDATQWDVHPPLYFAALHGWAKVAHSEFWLRLLSVLCSLSTLLVVGRMGSRPAALALLAVLTYHVQYSREVRMYPLLGLWIAIGLWKRRNVWVYSASVGLALWTHYFGAWLAAIGLVVCRNRRDLTVWLLGTLLGALLFSPWLLQIQSHGQDFGLRGAPTLLMLAEFPARVLLGDFLPAGNLALAALGLSIVALIVARARAVDRLWWAWAVLPWLGTWLVSQFVPLYEFKYLMWTAPAWAVLLADALPRAGVGAALALNLASFCWLYASEAGGNQDWRWAARLVQSRRQAGDHVLVHPSMMAAPLLYYGFRPEEMEPMDWSPKHLEDGRFWLVTTPNHPFVAQSTLLPELARTARLLHRFRSERTLPSAVVQVDLWQKGPGR